MRREGRQHGWVFTVDPSLVDAEGKPCRSRAVQVDGAAAGDGGFVRAPRKPTNHSKPAVGRAYKALIGKGETGGSGRGGHKFKHDEAKMYHHYLEGADDAYWDAMRELAAEDAYSIAMLDMMMECVRECRTLRVFDGPHCEEV